MNYIVSKEKDHFLIKMSGKFNKNATFNVREFLTPMLSLPNPKIVVDLSELPAGKDLVYQVGLLNAFRKEVDFAGGIFQINSLSPEMKNYFSQNRLDHIFEMTN
ncbi:MAG: hypothetical protein JW864_08805 [Spirochaetes bacterium]|nr:hypothetical protein [Spirochaetota bacterium]